MVLDSIKMMLFEQFESFRRMRQQAKHSFIMMSNYAGIQHASRHSGWRLPSSVYALPLSADEQTSVKMCRHCFRQNLKLTNNGTWNKLRGIFSPGHSLGEYHHMLLNQVAKIIMDIHTFLHNQEKHNDIGLVVGAEALAKYQNCIMLQNPVYKPSIKCKDGVIKYSSTITVNGTLTDCDDISVDQGKNNTNCDISLQVESNQSLIVAVRKVELDDCIAIFGAA